MKNFLTKPTDPNEGRPVIQIRQLSDGSLEVTGFIKESYQAYELLRKAKDYFVLRDKLTAIKKNGFH